MEGHRYIVYYDGKVFDVEIMANDECVVKLRTNEAVFTYSLRSGGDMLRIDAKVAKFFVMGIARHDAEIEAFLSDLENILTYGAILYEERWP